MLSLSRRRFGLAALGLAAAPVVGGATSLALAGRITVGGLTVRLSHPPDGFYTCDLGLLLQTGMTAQRIHAWPKGRDFCGESRAIKTPNGDYLLMFAAGAAHYAFRRDKVNDMVAYRSSDRGATWTGPKMPWSISYNQHGFVPLIPRGSRRIYAFGTQPRPDVFDFAENAAIGYRYSDDDGHTWSAVTLIEPRNDPGFRGMFVMRMCETGEGTWLLAPHVARWTPPPLVTWLYAMRGTERGKNWELLPHARPGGWTEPSHRRMEEGRPLSLGGARALMMARTSEGHLWTLRSEDDGRHWSAPEPTPLIHPSAPPMLFPLSDGRTLAAFHHNRYSGVAHTTSGHVGEDRSELWVSLSSDGGRRWSEPRFVLANAALPGDSNSALRWSVSYIDMFTDAGDVHMFISHQFRQVLHVQFRESLLEKMPDRLKLARRIGRY